MRIRWQRLALAAVCLGICGCGPSLPLDADVKSVGYDVFFGPPTALAPPAPSVSAPAPSLIPVYLPAPPGQPAAQPQISFAPAQPAVACPTAPPLAYPAVPASLTGPSAPPKPATYTYRLAGAVTLDKGKSDQAVDYYPGSETRQVTAVGTPDSSGAFAFSVVRKTGDATTTTAYHVYPHGPANPPANPAGQPGAGMYLTAFSSGSTVFDPQGAGVEIQAYPAVATNPYQAQGDDPVHQTSMTSNPPAVVLPGLPAGVGLPTSPPSQNAVPSGFIARGSHAVNACGTVIDSVENELIGTYTIGSDSFSFDYTFDVATQFGGIIVAEHLVDHGNHDPQSGKTFDRDVSATIDEVPQS